MTDRELLQQALDDYETGVQKIGGCFDGNCVVVKPKGMHTNGGCTCLKNDIRMKQLANVANRLVNTLRARLAQSDQEPFGHFQYSTHVDAWVQARAVIAKATGEKK
jgi:hypothetical protein